VLDERALSAQHERDVGDALPRIGDAASPGGVDLAVHRIAVLAMCSQADARDQATES